MAKKKTNAKKNTKQIRKAAVKKNSSTKTPAKKTASRMTAKATKKTKDSKKKKPRKPSGLDAAAQVLAKAKEPMRCKDIVDVMLSKGLWATGGKTPHATIYAAIIREISKKGKNARFKKTDRGLFTVNPVKKGA